MTKTTSRKGLKSKHKSTKAKSTAALNAEMDLGMEQTDFTQVSKIKIPEIFFRRFKTGIEKLDTIFGEGFLPGSTFTLTAEAGSGKTTLMLQMLESLSMCGKKVGYISGEESRFQLAYSCKRLKVEYVDVANMTDVDAMCLAVTQNKFDIVIVDAFQCLRSANAKGSKQTEAYAIKHLLNCAKINECTIGFIVHLTKMGVMKGTTLLPHSVDMNVSMEKGDESIFGTDRARIVAVYKNRFGMCQDTVLHMGGRGFDFDTDLNAIITRPNVSLTSKVNAKEAARKATITMFEAHLQVNKTMDLATAVQISNFDILKVKRFLNDMVLSGFCTAAGRGLNVVWTKV